MDCITSMKRCKQNSRGFTLIELTMVILIAGILSVGVTEFVELSVGSYVDRNDRNKMASVMVVAAEKLSRDIRRSLPNSVRIGGDVVSNDNCVEFIPILAGSHYVSVPIAPAAASFNAVSHGGASALSAYISVYPISIADLYSPTDASPSSLTALKANLPAGTDQIAVSLGAAHQFVTDSPLNRFFAVDDPIAYCQPSGSTRLYRYTNYGFNAIAVLPPVGASRDLLVDEVSSTDPVVFDYASSTLMRNAVVSFELASSVDGETLKLGQEVQIRNVP